MCLDSSHVEAYNRCGEVIGVSPSGDQGADVKIDCGPILIVDEDARFRAFVSRLFQRTGFVTTEVATGEMAIAAALVERPALVLLDLVLPDVGGFEVCQQLREEFGDDLPIIFVSGERTDPLDRAAGLLVGGDDYLAKPVDRDELLARVRRLLSRGDGGSRRLSRARGPHDAVLTKRELEVLYLLADGDSPKEIARQLVVSPKTVASHVQRISAKLGAHSRAEAIAIAYREGFVTPAVGAVEDRAGEAYVSIAAS